MKNYLFLGLVSATALFNSCSSDDNDANGKKLLLSKVTTTYYDDPSKPKTTVETSEYNSQGELIKSAYNGGNVIFEYSNGKPIKANYYNNKQQLDYYSKFYYTGNQLNKVESIYENSNSNRTLTYTYNPNGQLASSSLCQSTDCSNPSMISYTYSGDNVSVETSLLGGTIPITDKSEYTYDNKLSPYTNTNKYLRILMGRAITLSTNNYTIDKNSFKNNDNWVPSETTTYTYEYNSSGLPVKAIGKGSDGNLSVQYDYEYITL
ncbi:hypothetical protein HX126_14460 [Chryseobacterium indologenes]|uniref:hypothetical protein n=1 Tax=Chryseobacterium indologenes TaxID=253 RepID=UPI0025770874|nr:hypothetical protein [Chryseobacterium indologenes]MDM1555763.1 hypothetical protein [Chryseobacterium indologenes]